MPSNFSQQLGEIGMFNAVEQHASHSTSSSSRKALDSWVLSLEYSDFFTLSTEEEHFPYKSKWLRSCLDDDDSLQDSWRTFTSHRQVAKHKYLAIAFVSWHLYRNASGDQSPIVDIMAGPQLNHPGESILMVLTDAELFVIADNTTVVAPRFAIKSVSAREGFTNGRLVFAGHANEKDVFGVDEIPNDTLKKWITQLKSVDLPVKQGSIEQIALRDLGDKWRDWSGAIDALGTGLGIKEYAIDLSQRPTLIPAEIGSMHWTPTRDDYERLIEETGNGLQTYFNFAKIAISNDFEGLEDSEVDLGPERTIDILEGGIPLPICEAPPDVWRNADRMGPLGGHDPWDRLSEQRQVLIALSDQGVWRIPKSGSAIYFNPWSNISEATVYSKSASISEDAIDVFLFAGPQTPLQLSIWSEDGRIAMRNVFDPIKENDSLILVLMLRAEWLRVEPKHSKKLKLELNRSERKSVLPSQQQLAERVLLHKDLESIGMGWSLLPVFEDDTWITRDFDCPGCGRLASTLEGIRLRKSQLTALQDRLGEATDVQGLADWFQLQHEGESKVKPAAIQREFGLAYELSVQVIELFTNLDFFSPTHCEQCVQRRIQKTVSGRQSDRIGLPATLRFQVLQASGFRCHYCGRGSNSTPPVELEVDHIVPVAAGGTNDLGNLQAACRDCNRGKSATEIL